MDKAKRPIEVNINAIRLLRKSSFPMQGDYSKPKGNRRKRESIRVGEFEIAKPYGVAVFGALLLQGLFHAQAI